MPTVVGLDLSLTSTGWACGEDRRTLCAPGTGPARLVALRDALAALLDLVCDPVVALEGYAFASRNSQAHAIGELGGVVRVLLVERHIPYVEIPPTCRAKFATGRGNASKAEVVSAVSARTGIAWVGKGADDLCDAFVLEEMLRVHLDQGRYDWPASHREALTKIDWAPLTQ